MTCYTLPFAAMVTMKILQHQMQATTSRWQSELVLQSLVLNLHACNPIAAGPSVMPDTFLRAAAWRQWRHCVTQVRCGG